MCAPSRGSEPEAPLSDLVPAMRLGVVGWPAVRAPLVSAGSSPRRGASSVRPLIEAGTVTRDSAAFLVVFPYHLYRKLYHRAERRDHVGFARLAARAVGYVPVGPEHKRGRSPPHVQPPDQIQPDSASISTCVTPSTILDLGEDLPSGSARRAERRGELHQRRPPAEFGSQVTSRQLLLHDPQAQPAHRPGPPDPTALATTCPLRARHHNPKAVASTSAATAASTPKVTAGEQHPNAPHSRHPNPASFLTATLCSRSGSPDGAQAGGGRPERRRPEPTLQSALNLSRTRPLDLRTNPVTMVLGTRVRLGYQSRLPCTPTSQPPSHLSAAVGRLDLELALRPLGHAVHVHPHLGAPPRLAVLDLTGDRVPLWANTCSTATMPSFDRLSSADDTATLPLTAMMRAAAAASTVRQRRLRCLAPTSTSRRDKHFRGRIVRVDGVWAWPQLFGLRQRDPVQQRGQHRESGEFLAAAIALFR